MTPIKRTIKFVNYIATILYTIYLFSNSDLTFKMKDITMAFLILAFIGLIIVFGLSTNTQSRIASGACYTVFFFYFIVAGKLFYWNEFYEMFETLPRSYDGLSKLFVSIATIHLFINSIIAHYPFGELKKVVFPNRH